MKLYIANRISLRGSSDIVYEDGTTAFNVVGKTFSMRRIKRIFDAEGTLLYVVKNRLFNFFAHKAFIYDANGSKLCTVKDKFFNTKQVYSTNGSPAYATSGKFFGLEVKLLRDEQQIGTIRRNIGVFADKYELETDAEEIAFLAAFVIAIDNIRDNRGS